MYENWEIRRTKEVVMEQNNAIQNEEQEIDLLELFHALRRKWYMLLAALLVFALAAGAGTKLLITPQYLSLIHI